MVDTDKFLQELDEIKDKDQAFHLLIQIIRELNHKIKIAACTSEECRSDWGPRLVALESYVLGIGGSNGFKLQIKELEEKLEKIETEVQKWVVRATTAVLIFNLIVLPLLLYIFTHLFPGGTP